MNRALYAAATGMAAQQQNLDVIADNLANADVAGFKSAQATFEAIGGDESLGTASAGVHRIFAQGKLMKTGGAFDVAIDGNGFFRVERDGRDAYTRAGSFSRAADGTLRNPDGWTLRGVHIPANAIDVTVAPDGRVTATLDTHVDVTVGQIRLASFVAPEKLRPLGSALFTATSESGAPRAVPAGADRQAKIAFGMLEKSNVSTIESMMAILAAQRAYEANAKGVQAADEMLRIADCEQPPQVVMGRCARPRANYDRPMAVSLKLPLVLVDDADLVRVSEENPGYQFEREENGTLTVSPTLANSGAQSAEATYQLAVYAKRVGGRVFDSSTGFELVAP